jgi:RNA polymerase sigma factor (sigma-70 family)
LNKLQHSCNQPVKWQVNNFTGQNTTDRHLVEKVLSGDTRAFAVIVHNTEKLVAKIVFQLIQGDGDRKDIAQDIYLKAYQKLPTFKFQSKLSTWIGQIAYNTALDFLRKKKLVLSGLMNSDNEYGEENNMLENLMASKGVSAETADVFVINKNVSEIVKAGVEKLPTVYKTLITLYHQEQLSYEEIGEITGLPSGTVKSYLFRARRELKNDLLDQYKKEDLW